MIFIKLKLANREKSVYLNAEKITDLMLTDNEAETMVSIQGEQNFYNVLEKPEEIIEKIRAEEEKQNTLIVEGKDFIEDFLHDEAIRDFNEFDSMKKDLVEKEGFKD